MKRFSNGDRCTHRNGSEVAIVRLLGPAKYVENAWICRDERTFLVSVRAACDLEPYAPRVHFKKRTRARYKAGGDVDARRAVDAAAPATSPAAGERASAAGAPLSFDIAARDGMPLRPRGER